MARKNGEVVGEDAEYDGRCEELQYAYSETAEA
jgi:hypothetical protein